MGTYLQDNTLGPYNASQRGRRVIALEDLILAKEAIGRDQDRLTAIEWRVIAEKRKQRD